MPQIKSLSNPRPQFNLSYHYYYEDYYYRQLQALVKNIFVFSTAVQLAD